MTGGNIEQTGDRNTETLCGETAVRSQLETILQSPAFSGSPQLRSFLNYIVDQQLKGNASRIKGYTIAVEALGRATSFDPTADPIIRVEAARLRRLLGEYYGGIGAKDQVLIDVPKGGYVPTFQLRELTPVAQVDDPASTSAPPLNRWRSVSLLLAACLVIVLAVTSYLLLPHFGARGTTTQPNSETAEQKSETLLFKGELPRIYVADILLNGQARQPSSFSPAEVGANLSAALRLFSEVELAKTAAEADYRVESRATFTEDQAILSFVLTYAPEQDIIWSGLFDLAYDRNTAGHDEERIIRNITSAIARPYGVIFNHAASQHDDLSQLSEGFRCVLLGFDSQRRFAPDINARGRECLTSLAGRATDFASAQALLSMLHVDNARFGSKSEQEHEASLTQALTLAEYAILSTPDNARAYQALETVLLFLGRSDEALEAGRHARQLNPYDTDIMASHGSTLIMLGEMDEGLKLMQQARQLGPGHPVWYNTMIVFAAYGKGDRPFARKEAAQIQQDNTPSGLLARMLVAHGDGSAKAKIALLEKLHAQWPEFENDPRAALYRAFPSPSLRKQLLRALHATDLKSPY